MNELAVSQPGQLTALDIRRGVNLIREVMDAVMQVDVHYGKIPGTDKPTLYKPGAEKLACAFRIAPSYQLEDLSGRGFVRYRIRCLGTHQTSGIVLGEGMGECSSLEEKYRWKKAYATEFNHTPEEKRRTKYGWDRGARKEYEILQVATEPADLANTILKMACKRAYVAMILAVTGASDFFTQDIEDLPEDLRPQGADNEGAAPATAVVEQPKSKTESAQAATAEPAKAAASTEEQKPAVPASAGALKMLRTKLEASKKAEADLCAHMKVEKLEDITMSTINAALEWARS